MVLLVGTLLFLIFSIKPHPGQYVRSLIPYGWPLDGNTPKFDFGWLDTKGCRPLSQLCQYFALRVIRCLPQNNKLIFVSHWLCSLCPSPCRIFRDELWFAEQDSSIPTFSSLKVAQLCSKLYSPWNSPGQNTGVGSLSFLQGIFPIQGWNPDLPHCRWILYQLIHQGSPTFS